MRLLSLELTNFRSHEHTVLDLAAIQAAAVVGPNGAGKSTIIEGLRWGLFGGSPDDMLRFGAERGGVTLELGDEKVRYRITRSREREKKSILLVERVFDHTVDYSPLNRHTVAESQKLINDEVLGMDEDAFCASVYAPQGQVGLLASLGPTERKGLLGGLLGLDAYDEWRKKAAEGARFLDGKIQGTITNIEAEKARLVSPTFDLDELGEQIAREQDLAANLESELKEGQAALIVNQQVARRTSLVRQMNDLKQRAAEAKKAEERREAIEKRLGELHGAEVRWAEWEWREDEHRRNLSDFRARTQEADRRKASAAGALEGAQRRAHAAVARHQKASHGVVDAETRTTPQLKCPTCGQNVHDEAAAQVQIAMERDLEAVRSTEAEAKKQMDDLMADVEAAKHEVALVAELTVGAAPTFDDTGRADALLLFHEQRDLNAELKYLNVPDVAKLRAEWSELRKEAEALPTERIEVKRTVDRITSELESARQNVGVLERRRERAQAELEQHERTLRRIETLEREAETFKPKRDALATLARAFSRDGIPAMILDNAVGGIEAAANDALGDLGSSMTLRLVTQRAKKSGGMSETLEIMVDDGIIERPIATFSGGEKYRVHVALRLGLAAMLASGSGRTLDFLLIDEPTDLDGPGVALLADLLTKSGRQTVLVTHQSDLVDALPQRIGVERTSMAAPSEVSVT